MKQRIDHSNYEAFLLDRMEGNLTPEQERELAAFLLLNPHLDPGHEELPTVSDLAEGMQAMDKEVLKRTLPPVAAVDATNIDDHLVARLENDLTAEQRQALELFLVMHPEHMRAERLYALTKLVPEAMAFAERNLLQRALPPVGLVDRFTLDDHLVAALEGDLNAEQQKALSGFIALNPNAARAQRLMLLTRVQAEAIAFPDKDALKKSARVIAIGARTVFVRLAAAATVALLLGTAWWWLSRGEVKGGQVAITPKEQASPKDGMQQNGNATSNELPVEQPTAPGEQKLVDGSPERTPTTHDAPALQNRHKGVPVPVAPAPIEPGEAPVAQKPEQQAPAQPNTPAPVVTPDPEPVLASSNSTPETVRAVQNNTDLTLGQALAATMRERVLDRPADERRPLDGDDAVAAVDKGLKAVGGERAGLSVSREQSGRARGFNLRLGRNLAITASR